MFRKKKGSVILSIVASGAVAASIVATHQVTQNFVAGAAQEFNFHQATLNAQRFLTLASLMVNRGIITCSNKMNHHLVQSSDLRKNTGCRINSSHIDYRRFVVKKNIRSSIFSLPRRGEKEGVLTMRGRSKDTNAHLFKPASPFYGVKKVEWNLRNWHEPSVRAAFGSLSKGYFCQHKRTSKMIEEKNNECQALGSEAMVTKNQDEIYKAQTQCGKNNQGICNYFSAADNDDQSVMISVTVDYIQSTSNAKNTSGEKKSITLNAVVRRPIALTTTYLGKRGKVPSCTFSCEVMSDGGTGLHIYRQCGGLSAGQNTGSNKDHRYPKNTQLVGTQFYIKNHGPGTLYNARFKREDIEMGTNRVLMQTMVQPIGHVVSASKEALIVDQVPCYLSSAYHPSAKAINSSCESVRTVHTGDSRRSKIQSDLKQVFGNVEFNTALSQASTNWVATTNSTMSQIKETGGIYKTFPLTCQTIANVSGTNTKGVAEIPASASSAKHHSDCGLIKDGLSAIKQPEYPACNFIDQKGINVPL